MQWRGFSAHSRALRIAVPCRKNCAVDIFEDGDQRCVRVFEDGGQRCVRVRVFERPPGRGMRDHARVAELVAERFPGHAVTYSADGY